MTPTTGKSLSFCQNGSRIRDSWPSGHGLTPSRGGKESQTIIFVFKKKQGRCTLRIGTWHRFNSHRAKQLSSLGHKQLFACIKKRRHGALLIQTAWNWLKRMCHNLTSYPWQRLRNKWFRYCNLRTHSNKVCHGLPFTRCPDQGYLNRIVTNTLAYPYMTNGHIRLTSPNWFHEGVCTHPSQQYTVRVDFPFSFLLARMGHSSLSDRSHKEMVIKAKVW